MAELHVRQNGLQRLLQIVPSSVIGAALGDPTTLHFAGTVTSVTTGPLPASLVLTLGALGLSNLLSISRGRSRRY
jgi:hypothetical protein